MVHEPTKGAAGNGSACEVGNGILAALGNKAANDKASIDEGTKRCIFAYQVLVGYTVEVKTKDYSIYQGIFSSMSSDGLVLRMAKLIRDKNGPAPRAVHPQPKMVIPQGDWIDITANDVRMSGSDVSPFGAADDVGGFGTDAAISRGRGAAEGRELQRWTPDIDESQLMHLEESSNSNSRGWDQFALNERKFGVKTDYREELYTTALDPSKSKITVEEAERLAAEIERGMKGNTTNNIHLLEERGIDIDDGDMDEEDRYGAVIRDVPPPPSTARIPATVTAPPPPPGRPAGVWARGAPTSSAPIAIDPRKETNKVRAQMTGATSTGPKATSPYGTPKQLASPLVGDAQMLAALNLNPGVPKVDEATMREFEKFKASSRQKSANDTALNVSDFKQSSESFTSKIQQRKSAETKLTSTTSTASSITDTGGGALSIASPSSATAVTPSPSHSSEPKKSTLNPNAKAFSFNVNAREFTPGAASTSTTMSATAKSPMTPGTASSTFAPSTSASRPLYGGMEDYSTNPLSNTTSNHVSDHPHGQYYNNRGAGGGRGDSGGRRQHMHYGMEGPAQPPPGPPRSPPTGGMAMPTGVPTMMGAPIMYMPVPGGMPRPTMYQMVPPMYATAPPGMRPMQMAAMPMPYGVPYGGHQIPPQPRGDHE